MRGSSHEFHRLFVDRQNNAPGLAGERMLGAGLIDAQRAGGRDAVFIALRAGQDEDVFVAGVAMTRDFRSLAITDEGGGRALDTVAVKMINIDALAKRFPCDLILPFDDMEKIRKLDGLGRRPYNDLGFHELQSRHNVG